MAITLASANVLHIKNKVFFLYFFYTFVVVVFSQLYVSHNVSVELLKNLF